MALQANHLTIVKSIGRILFEFFMLFLAVFLGYQAQDRLERKLDKEREESYMQNMYKDLNQDLSHYDNQLKNIEKTFGQIDSLIILIKKADREKYLSEIYFFARTTTVVFRSFYFSERTYDQMKNSGHLSLIRNQEIASNVSDYYNTLRLINIQNDFINNRVSDYMKYAGQLFDAEALLNVFKDKIKPSTTPPKLLSDDPIVINEFLTSAQYLYGATKILQDKGKDQISKAKNLIALIKKEYKVD